MGNGTSLETQRLGSAISGSSEAPIKVRRPLTPPKEPEPAVRRPISRDKEKAERIAPKGSPRTPPPEEASADIPAAGGPPKIEVAPPKTEQPAEPPKQQEPKKMSDQVPAPAPKPAPVETPAPSPEPPAATDEDYDDDEYYDEEEEEAQPEGGTRPYSAVNDELFKSLEDRSLTYEEALDKIEPVMRNLKKLDNVGYYNTAIGFFFLNKFCSSATTDDRKREKWVERLNETAIAELTAKLWPAFQKPDFLTTGPGANGNQKSYNYQSFHFLWSILWNGSDCSVNLTKAIVNNNILEICLQLLKRTDFKPEGLINDSERQWITKSCLGILHNCLRLNTVPSKRRLRAADVINILKRYLKADVALIRTKASIILAYVAEEHEMEIIDANDDIIRIMVKVLLEPALRAPKRRSLGFSVEETADALNALAKHDENKRRMVKQGVIPMLMHIIKKPSYESELIVAVKGLWMLTFIPEGVEAMKKNTECIPSLTSLKSHRNGMVSRGAAGALWNINGGQAYRAAQQAKEAEAAPPGTVVETKPATPKGTPHIMISYDHWHKDVVYKLNEMLRANGYVTWVDYEHMHGSTLDAMAVAVETAACILLCFSERYQESPNCRLEAEYAYKMQKDVVPVRTERFRPTGWLNMLLGTRFWVNCYTVEEVPDQLPKIMKELGGRGKGGSAPPAPKDAVLPPKSKDSGSNKNGGKPLEQWTHAEVQKWLVKNDLGHIGGKLTKFDGALMAQFRSMYRNSPGVQFYDSAKTFLGISDLADLLKLTQKMEYI